MLSTTIPANLQHLSCNKVSMYFPGQLASDLQCFQNRTNPDLAGQWLTKMDIFPKLNHILYRSCTLLSASCCFFSSGPQ